MARTSLTAAHMKPVQDQLLELWPRTDSEAVVRAVPVNLALYGRLRHRGRRVRPLRPVLVRSRGRPSNRRIVRRKAAIAHLTRAHRVAGLARWRQGRQASGGRQGHAWFRWGGEVAGSFVGHRRVQRRRQVVKGVRVHEAGGTCGRSRRRRGMTLVRASGFGRGGLWIIRAVLRRRVSCVGETVWRLSLVRASNLVGAVVRNHRRVGVALISSRRILRAVSCAQRQ
jgi:hypothetical protein